MNMKQFFEKNISQLKSQKYKHSYFYGNMNHPSKVKKKLMMGNL